MARSRARPSGQIRSISAQPSGRTIITIWSNPNGSYLRDRTLTYERCAQLAHGLEREALANWLASRAHIHREHAQLLAD